MAEWHLLCGRSQVQPIAKGAGKNPSLNEALESCCQQAVLFKQHPEHTYSHLCSLHLFGHVNVFTQVRQYGIYMFSWSHGFVSTRSLKINACSQVQIVRPILCVNGGRGGCQTQWANPNRYNPGKCLHVWMANNISPPPPGPAQTTATLIHVYNWTETEASGALQTVLKCAKNNLFPPVLYKVSDREGL